MASRSPLATQGLRLEALALDDQVGQLRSSTRLKPHVQVPLLSEAGASDWPAVGGEVSSGRYGVRGPSLEADELLEDVLNDLAGNRVVVDLQALLRVLDESLAQLHVISPRASEVEPYESCGPPRPTRSYSRRHRPGVSSPSDRSKVSRAACWMRSRVRSAMPL